MIFFNIFGDKNKIDELIFKNIDQNNINNPYRLVVSDEETPLAAIKNSKNTSVELY